MTNEISRIFIHPDTGETIALVTSEEDFVASVENPQIIRDKVNAVKAEIAEDESAIEQFDGDKVTTLLNTITADIATLDTNLGKITGANAGAVRDMVKDMMENQKHLLIQNQYIVKALRRLSKQRRSR